MAMVRKYDEGGEIAPSPSPGAAFFVERAAPTFCLFPAASYTMSFASASFCHYTCLLRSHSGVAVVPFAWGALLDLRRPSHPEPLEK